MPLNTHSDTDSDAKQTKRQSRELDDQLTFVTVVYEGELPLLALQARSLVQFIEHHIIAQIIILVNDVDEESLIQKIKDDYLHFYGPLADRVRVVRSADVFTGPQRSSLLNRFLTYWAKNPQLRFRKRRGGWQCNNGWSMQQAFKLCSARVAHAKHIVLLDTKNVFVKQMRIGDFVDDMGKPRTNFVPIENLHRRWLPPSCKALGITYREDLLAETTQFTTPFVMDRDILLELLESFETRHDSVQGIFARRFIKPTEFMLINVYCRANYGALDKVFSAGLVQAHSFHTSTNAAQVDAILDQAEQDKVAIFGLHITVMGRLSPEQFKRLRQILIDKNIIDEQFNFAGMIQTLTAMNAARIDKSKQRLSSS